MNAPLVLAGDAAPELWLLIARTGWLLGPILAFALAARLRRERDSGDRSGALVAGGLAAVGVIALEDPLTPWLRQFGGGLGEPILLALTLAAALLALDGRWGAVWSCGVAVGLLRPESWSLLVIGGIWLWRNDPRMRPWIVATAVALPAAWFVPDLLSSGSALTGVDRAAAPDGGLSRVPGAFLDGLLLAPAGLLIAAAVGLREDRLAGRVGPRALLAAAGALWFATTLALTLLGFAGLARFFVPAAAIACALGAVALVELVRAGGLERGRRIAVGGLCLLTALGVGWRLAQLPADARVTTAYGESIADLEALVERVGPERMLGCGSLTTTDVQSQAALVWMLEGRLASVAISTKPPRSGLLLVDTDAAPAPGAFTAAVGDPIAEEGVFSLYEVSCSADAEKAGAVR